MTAEPTSPQRGRFIVLEGLDGCGKTTQIEALAAWLPQSGLLPEGASLVTTKEPGSEANGPGICRAIRELVLYGASVVPYGDDAFCERENPSPMAELLLYMADRAHHVDTVIRPALERGDWVLCDRYHGSTIAYQGYGRGHDLGLIERLYTAVAREVRPDLVLWLDLPLNVYPERFKARARGLDRIESDKTLSRSVLYEAFRYQWQLGSRWVRINAYQPIEAVTDACKLDLTTLFLKPAVSLGVES